MNSRISVWFLEMVSTSSLSFSFVHVLLLILFSCLCFLVFHFISLRELIVLNSFSDNSQIYFSLGLVIRVLLVSFGGVMFP